MIKKETLEKYGAVSEEVAREMLAGLNTDIGISTTGIAGPDGGTKDKPLGKWSLKWKFLKES